MKSKQEEFLVYYQKHHEAFGRFCRAYTYGIIEAEDLMGESLLRAFERFDQLSNKEAFLSYLIGISKNIVTTKIRRKKFFAPFNETEAYKIVSNTVSADDQYDIKLLYQCIQQLPAKQKEAIVLFEISGYSIKEICKIQNSGESAVKQRLKRGRMKLGDLLKIDELKSESILRSSNILTNLFF